jgi:hypothetical protein
VLSAKKRRGKSRIGKIPSPFADASGFPAWASDEQIFLLRLSPSPAVDREREVFKCLSRRVLLLFLTQLITIISQGCFLLFLFHRKTLVSNRRKWIFLVPQLTTANRLVRIVRQWRSERFLPAFQRVFLCSPFILEPFSLFFCLSRSQVHSAAMNQSAVFLILLPTMSVAIEQ